MSTVFPLSDRDLKQLRAIMAIAERSANTHDGERLAALDAAERLFGKAGVQLRDLPRLIFFPPRAPFSEVDDLAPSKWRDLCTRCLQQGELLNDWESNFLNGLRRRRRLTAKQISVLYRIAQKCGAES